MDFASGLNPDKLGGVKHKGKAAGAALRLLLASSLLAAVFLALGFLARGGAFLNSILFWLVAAVWAVFVGFCLYFFRDPDPATPEDPRAIVAPAHGRVDLIDQTVEPQFLGGDCRRISIFLSVIDVHVENAPVSGTIACLQHNPGRFVSALQADSCAHNENVLIGFASNERPDERVAVRLVAGVLARRIVPWVRPDDTVARGERISLIQFGSRCDLYLPLDTEVCVKLGDHVRGGETVIARRI